MVLQNPAPRGYEAAIHIDIMLFEGKSLLQFNLN